MRVTWFVTGEVAAWYPDVIEALVADGHELAYHTHLHPPRLTPDILTRELRSSETLLRRFRPRGFRAPAIFLPRACYTILREAGFSYSSSTYGLMASLTRIDGVTEIPVSTHPYWNRSCAPITVPRTLTLSLLCRELPYGSGMLLAVAGARGIAWCIRHGEARGERSNLFVHNWQLFAATPEQRSFRRRVLLKQPAIWPYFQPTLPHLMSLLDAFTFGRLSDAVPTNPQEFRDESASAPHNH